MEHEDGTISVLVRRALAYPPVTITPDSLKVTVPVESDSVKKNLECDVEITYKITKSRLFFQRVSA